MYRLALAVCAAGLCASAASADVVEIGSMQDTTLYQDATGGLGNGSGDHFFAGKTASGSLRRGLIAFDIASMVPAGAEITGVDLTLYMSRTIGGATDIGVHRTLASWGEGASDALGEEGGGAPAEPGDATWLHRFYDDTLWTNPGGDFDAAASATTSVGGIGSYTWTSAGLVADVQAWVDDPAANFGWLLMGDEVAFAVSKRFDTRENPTVAHQPLLRVEYLIPAPGAMGLMLLGLSRRRRRRN